MKTIAVTSGKGGVGKTSLSANIGAALAATGVRTIVFDADLALANVELLMGAAAERNLMHVVAEECSLAEAVSKGPNGVGYIAGGSGIPTLMRSGPKRLELFFEQVRELESSTDVLIFDTAAGLENRVLAFLKAADEVLLVATPEPASVMDAYATVKTVYRHKPDAVVNVLVNAVVDRYEAQSVFTVLERIVKQFVHKEIEYLGFVRKDDAVGRCARNRSLFVVTEPKSHASADARSVAKHIAGPGVGFKLAC